MELSTQVINIMDALCEKIGIAVDWSQQNVLPYFQELIGKFITYEIATSATWIVLAAIGLFADLKGCKFLYKKSRDTCWDDDATIWAVICGIAIFFGCTAVLVVQLFDIVTCITLPEKIILEMVSKLT